MPGYVITTSSGNRSAPNYFFALGRELARRGHEVLFLVDGRRAEAEVPAGNPRVLTWPSPRPTGWKDARFLYRILRAMKPDAILGNFGAQNISILVGALTRVPVRAAWYHTLNRQRILDHPVPVWKRRLLESRKRFVFRCATHVVGVSDAAVEDVRTTYGVPAAKSRAMRLLIPDPLAGEVVRDPTRVVCVGRLHPSKGQAVLIRALAAIRAAIPNVRAEFIGDGPSREEYRQLAVSLGVDAQCHFSGWQPLENVLERMAGAAVGVVASQSEALGLAALEAGGVGLPVVASRVDGINEIVRHGETGYLVSPDDPAAFAERIIELLRSERLRDDMGRTARQHFLDAFCVTGIGRHADALEEMRRESRPPPGASAAR